MIEHLIRAATCRTACGPDSESEDETHIESGTGWIIAKGIVLTARHCVLQAIEAGSEIRLFFPVAGETGVPAMIVAESEDLDACILSAETPSGVDPLRLGLELPREGENWETFGYPRGKTTLGHRLSGTVAQILNPPQLKIDLDLSIAPSLVLKVYSGMSGSTVVCEGLAVGMIRLKIDGTVAALSLYQLASFLSKNGVPLPNDRSAKAKPLLADREDFPSTFAEAIRARRGKYLFLEGAHGYGKSTFCRNFRADERNFINLEAYCLSDPGSALGADYRAQPQVFCDWVTTKISGLISGKPPRKQERSYSEQIQQTAEYLNEFSKYCAQSGRQGIFFIDGLNEIAGETPLRELLGLLPPTLPPHLTVILTSPNFSNLEVALAGKVKRIDVFGLPPLPAPSCSRYCWRTLQPERRSIPLVDRICEKANGHPLYLRYLIEYSNHQPNDETLNDFPILSGTIEEYYHGIWAKLLSDAHAVNFLALMVRLRWGLPLSDFAKALNAGELPHFLSVISRIRHLLADIDTTTIYHHSFAAFVLEQTADIEDLVYCRLAEFCCEKPEIRYCTLNRIFHLDLARNNNVFAECNQVWFDSAVKLGVEPDALIVDVEAVVQRAANEGSADEFFCLKLLTQRISFRYNTLFAQSARLIAEALIVLGRPAEALTHVIRLKTLILDTEEALEIAFLLHQHNYIEEGLILLDMVQRRILESYHSPILLGQFLDLCSWHLKTHFQIRLAVDGSGMEQFNRIIDLAKNGCSQFFKNDAEQLDDCLQPLIAESTTYFLSFRDEYADISRINTALGGGADLTRLFPSMCFALLKFASEVDGYQLGKHRKSLSKFFDDLAELLPNAKIKKSLVGMMCDVLIRFGAPASLVAAFSSKGPKTSQRKLRIKAKNGVDVNHRDLQECHCEWRLAAFLQSTFRGPSNRTTTFTGWFESIECLIGALYCCDGKSRRAKVDDDEVKLIACRQQLKAEVIEPLRFTLQQRSRWTDSYAIPETAIPRVYHDLAELLNDCFPEELPEWLDSLLASVHGQWGMYSEGFRAAVFQVIQQLTKERSSYGNGAKLLGLLRAWRDHVLCGVENRHELVPELLRMIPMFALLGAKEEADGLYQHLLSVSMGPTWYKEDQLGIMNEVLGSIGLSSGVGQKLPQIAGYLEKASGEMTFQRYVRAEKSTLLGQIARHGKYKAALAYFRRQCCGTTTELWAEAENGPIDKVGPLKGTRFPGGALDDQAATLALVKNSKTVSWGLRWAILEIFHCGDHRHLVAYAETFAEIANEVGAEPEIVRRAEILTHAETPSCDSKLFASAFRNNLNSQLHSAFSSVLSGLSPIGSPAPSAPAYNGGPEDDDAADGLFSPGIFGRQSALRETDKILEEAERHWSLGNRKAAKTQAAKVLKTAQDGGWSIWGNLSAEARRAEEIIAQEEVRAESVIHHYAPLINAERHVPKWVPAHHLIGKVGPLLSNAEGQKLLDVVINHVRLIVTDAPHEIELFGFLANDEPDINPDVEFFQFLVWLCNHPQWVRRERAAAMLLWVVELIPELFAEAASTAFSIEEGYGPDVLAGVLDGASAREPTALWHKVESVIDLAKITRTLKHTSRMTVLERLATRADKAGSSSAKAAMALMEAAFSGKGGMGGQSATGGNPILPNWAGCLKSEWPQIVNLINSESVATWQRVLEQMCYPLKVEDALHLETAVTTSFRETHNRPLNRWESKVRDALNFALWSSVSRREAAVVEAALRSYNPSQPERTVQGINNPFTDQLLSAITAGDYSAVLCSNPTAYLNYHDMAVKPTEDGADHVEVLCLLLNSSTKRGDSLPKLDQSFCSSQLPAESTVRTPFETCCRLTPEFMFFGSFTPPIPLTFFQKFVGAKKEDFIQQTWRFGRRNQMSGFSLPERVGCSLSVPRKALNIPLGFKLVWIVWLNGKKVAVVDMHDNKLI